MAITPSDINLQNFLEKFTFDTDPNPENKIKLPMVDFLKIASQLKLDFTIQNSVRFLRTK